MCWVKYIADYIQELPQETEWTVALSEPARQKIELLVNCCIKEVSKEIEVFLMLKSYVKLFHLHWPICEKDTILKISRSFHIKCCWNDIFLNFFFFFHKEKKTTTDQLMELFIFDISWLEPGKQRKCKNHCGRLSTELQLISGWNMIFSALLCIYPHAQNQNLFLLNNWPFSKDTWQ